MITFKKTTLKGEPAYDVFYDDYHSGVICYDYDEWLFFPDDESAYDVKMLRSIAAAIDAIEAHKQPKDDEE